MEQLSTIGLGFSNLPVDPQQKIRIDVELIDILNFIDALADLLSDAWVAEYFDQVYLLLRQNRTFASHQDLFE